MSLLVPRTRQTLRSNLFRFAAIGGALWVGCGVGFAEEVRVYTNADLEKYAVEASTDSADSPAPPSPETAAEWDFVTDFIAREQRRIQIERKDGLTRQALEAEIAAQEAAAERAENEWRYRPIYRPWRGVFDRAPARIGGYRYGMRHGRGSDRRSRDDAPGDASKTDPARHDRIVPLHAR